MASSSNSSSRLSALACSGPGTRQCFTTSGMSCMRRGLHACCQLLPLGDVWQWRRCLTGKVADHGPGRGRDGDVPSATLHALTGRPTLPSEGLTGLHCGQCIVANTCRLQHAGSRCTCTCTLQTHAGSSMSAFNMQGWGCPRLQAHAARPREPVDAAGAVPVQVSEQLVEPLWRGIVEQLPIHLQARAWTVLNTDQQQVGNSRCWHYYCCIRCQWSMARRH